jgi:hypothetical protein
MFGITKSIFSLFLFKFGRLDLTEDMKYCEHLWSVVSAVLIIYGRFPQIWQ